LETKQVKLNNVDQLKQFAGQVCDILQKTIGVTEYVKAYQAVSDQVKFIRDDRKEKRAILAVSDPAQSAKRKIIKNVQKKNQKKRKMIDSRAKQGKSKC
jgi:U3 small nucleolar RNA-associated protein 20